MNNNEFKILSVNNSDSHGGAAKAAYRIHKGLLGNGIDANLLVKSKIIIDETIAEASLFYKKGIAGIIEKYRYKIKNRIVKNQQKKYTTKNGAFIADLGSIPLKRALRNIKHDILHLHFVTHRFLNLNELTLIKKPIIWTLHDAWAFTGLCHYFENCTKFIRECGACPLLRSNNKNDISYKKWKEKFKVYKNLNLTIVTPSKWLATEAKKSSLLRNKKIFVIPNCIDIEFYRILNKPKLFKEYSLNSSKIQIAFGAIDALSDERKGFLKLKEALTLLEKGPLKSKIELIIFGSVTSSLVSELKFPIHCFGEIKDETEMVKIYNLAEVIIIPSLFENLSNIIMESLASGTPVIAFNIGGNPDMVEHMQNGYLARPYEAEDLANGIVWCIENNKEGELSKNARNKVIENFTIKKTIQKHIELYKSLI